MANCLSQYTQGFEKRCSERGADPVKVAQAAAQSRAPAAKSVMSGATAGLGKVLGKGVQAAGLTGGVGKIIGKGLQAAGAPALPKAKSITGT